MAMKVVLSSAALCAVAAALGMQPPLKKARTEAEMDALDGKIRRLLRTRDAEIASLRDALSAARGERDRARGYLEELGNELPVSGRVAAAAGDCY